MENNKESLDSLNNALRPLSNFEKPSEQSNADMISEALKILEMSVEGQKLFNLVGAEDLSIKLIYTSEDTTYLPSKKELYVSLSNKNRKDIPILMILIASLLKDYEQEKSGKLLANSTDPVEKHIKIAVEKQADKLASLCAIAYELDELKLYPEYSFLDVLKNLGHNEAVDIFINNV